MKTRQCSRRRAGHGKHWGRAHPCHPLAAAGPNQSVLRTGSEGCRRNCPQPTSASPPCPAPRSATQPHCESGIEYPGQLVRFESNDPRCPHARWTLGADGGTPLCRDDAVIGRNDEPSTERGPGSLVSGGPTLVAAEVKVEELTDAAQLASLADETPEGRSLVVLAIERLAAR